jgi:hypothetical protein
MLHRVTQFRFQFYDVKSCDEQLNCRAYNIDGLDVGKI